MYVKLIPWRLYLAVSTAVRRGWRLARKITASFKRRRKVELQLVQTSSLFDHDWYLKTYADVARAGTDPLLHYLTLGWREGRDPGPEFSTLTYLKANADVALSGVNPLVHFIEFGHAEGRETFGQGNLPHNRSAMSFDFGRPAECVSFPLDDRPAVLWRRAYRLDEHRPDSLRIGNWIVGYSADPDVREMFQAALAQFRLLSGYERGAPEANHADLPDSTERLLDAWYVNASQLRTRWNGKEFPFVIRAFQHDPRRDGEVSLVGEALVSSTIDVIDLDLSNPFFPVLFVFADPQGRLRAALVLAFPSLCRGGIHYSELLRSAAHGASEPTVDPLRESQRLAFRLNGLMRDNAIAAVTSIEVDLRGADGRGPMFQPDFKLWLEKVTQTRVVPAALPHDSVAQRFLAQAVTVTPHSCRREEGPTLILQHDMVPTIAALTEPHQGREGPPELVSVPLLVTGLDPAQPCAHIELPREAMPAMEALLDVNLAKWPQLRTEGQRTPLEVFPPAAIRLQRGVGLSEAELFVPVANGKLSDRFKVRRTFTWLIKAEDWKGDHLAKSLQSIALQQGGSGDSIAFVGYVDSLTVSIAMEAFAGRVTTFPDMGAAIRSLDTSLAGFVGSGVLLHDNRSAAIFSSLLESEVVATVSSVLISVEKRGRIWHPTIAEGPALATPAGPGLARPDNAAANEQLWRTDYPVASPCPDLWVARSSRLAAWIEKPASLERGKGVHICSSVVTASYLEKGTSTRLPAFIPQAPHNSVTKVETLFG